MFNNWDHTKTYATAERLQKELDRLGYTDNRVLVVKVPGGKNEGRFTAVIPLTAYGVTPAHDGFKVLG